MTQDAERTSDSQALFAAWSAWAQGGKETATYSLLELEEAANAHAAPAEPFEMSVESDPCFRAEPIVLEPGSVFAGFEVQGTLGSGGMATVYRAWDPKEQTAVALKLLHRGLVTDDRHLRRFRREARVASRLRHPHIVATHTYGEVGGAAYLTMPLVDGPSLEQRVEQGGPLAPLEAARVVEQVARAIDAAHAQRVVHRDIKPSNIMVHAEDGPLVVDFGLAKHLHHDPSLTETGEILGTPSYLAPEAVSPKADPADHRMDVYGLGGVLFFLLTGQPPHSGESAIKVLQAILHSEPPRLCDVNPELPKPLEIVCAKAMARDPRDRYPTAAALASDLARFQAEARVSAKLPGPAQRLWRGVRARPGLSALLLTALALLVGGGLVVRSLAERVALHERSERGLELLRVADGHARAQRHDVADRTYLQAMLVTKGAFLEAPDDDMLRAALARVKRARVIYAESRGNWALAEELRQNLARLESNAVLPPPADPQDDCVVRIEGLASGAVVRFYASHSGEPTHVAEVRPESPVLSLPAGSYIAVALDPAGSPQATFLVVLDPGHRHVLRLDRETPPPPGVFRLPGGVQGEGGWTDLLPPRGAE